MADIITGGIVVLLLGAAIAYIVKQKKRGVRCIGCSMGGTCGGNCSCAANIDADAVLKEIKVSETCSCGCHTERE